MRRIVCPSCGQSDEGFSVVHALRVVTDIDAHGEQQSETTYGNPLNGQSLTCPSCGHNWPTRRYFPIDVDVR